MKLGVPLTREEVLDFYREQAELLAKTAEENGVIVTIERVPKQPLAMRNFTHQIDVREMR
jgi:hypothetical protein